MTNEKQYTIIKIVLPLIIAAISILVISKYATSVEFHKTTIESLDKKKTNVMELTAASTAASAAITLIPGDTGTPIAEKLADLSSYFLVVLCAIYLEKYLVTITGYATFVFLIPVGCLLISIGIIRKQRFYHFLAAKLILIGLAISTVIPASVKVSSLIEATYESSIHDTIDAAKASSEELEEDKKEQKGVFSKIVSTVTDGVTNATKQMEQVLNHFVEALAVMLVTSCMIPIIVMLFFIWLIQVVFGVSVDMSRFPSASKLVQTKTKTLIGKED